MGQRLLIVNTRWLWIRSPIEGIIFMSLLWKIRLRVVSFSTQHAMLRSPSSAEERIILTLGSPCLPFYMRVNMNVEKDVYKENHFKINLYFHLFYLRGYK